MRVRKYERVKQAVEAEGTTEETLKLLGLDTSELVDIVFENIERSARDG